MSERLSKYIAAFDYIDKTLIVSSATSGGISIISFTIVIGISAGIASASFTSIFSLTTGIIKKLLKATRKKKKNHNKSVMLAKSELNSIVCFFCVCIKWLLLLFRFPQMQKFAQ